MKKEKERNPFWKHSQCRGCIHVKIVKKQISCPHHSKGISLKVEQWDILCKHRSLGEGTWIDDTMLFAMGEKFKERAKRFTWNDEDIKKERIKRFGDTDLSYIEVEKKGGIKK